MLRGKIFVTSRNFVLQFVNRPWFPALVAVLAAVDLIILIIPTDLFLISAVMGQTRRWLSIGITIAIGSTIGALILALAIKYDQEWIHQTFPKIFHSSNWEYAESLIERFGIYATFIAAIGPLPLQPFVIIGALSTKLSLQAMILSIFVGRTAKFILFAWLASHAPRYLEKLWLPKAQP